MGKKRKSPYRHHVRGHARAGISVHAYERGKGEKPRRKARRVTPKPPKEKGKGGRFGFHITYVDASHEAFDVRAPSYVRALDEGFEARTRIKEPAVIRLKRL